MTNLILPKKRKLITTAVAAAGLLLAQPASPAIILAPSISAALEAIGFERPHHRIAPDVFAMFTLAKFATATQGGGPSGPAVTFVTSGYATGSSGSYGQTVSGLSGILAGDKVLFLYASNNATAPGGGPFPVLTSGSLPIGGVCVLYAGTAAGGETSFGLYDGNFPTCSAAVVVYRGVTTTSTPTAEQVSATGSGTITGITCVGGGVLICFGVSNGFSAGAYMVFTPDFNARVGSGAASPVSNGRGVTFNDKASVAGATGSIAFSNGGTQYHWAGALELY